MFYYLFLSLPQLQIWDTAGQERFRSITQSYYRSAHALILVYDISCQPTFDCLPDWLREIEEYASNKVLRILVGNKIDREDREIPTHVGEDFAQRHGMYFLETSAKEAENVERLFMEIAAELMEVSVLISLKHPLEFKLGWKFNLNYEFTASSVQRIAKI